MNTYAKNCQIPSELYASVQQDIDTLRLKAEKISLAWPQDPSFEQHLQVLFICSQYASRFSCRFPDLLLSDEALKMLYTKCDLSYYVNKVREVIAQNVGEDRLMQRLRLLRQREMIRIAWRDLNSLADTTECLRNLSELAEAFIDQTLKHCYLQTVERFGTPRSKDGVEQKPLVLGMGKLGGFELNYSSDIDLIFAFAEPGKADGRKELDLVEFYRRMIQLFVRLLNENTADGFVYRVDLRLRPFGSSGPMAMSFDALEAYYQTQGREWERYAMIKARVVSGSKEAAKQLSVFLSPFIYRRYLDYSAFDSLRDLKSKITAQVKRKGMQNNIKLGAGGIREIEFIGQAFQLVRGGKETELQHRSIVTVLKLLGEKQYLTDDETEQLLQAYDFLRRTENRLQMLQDQQTHVLPEQSLEQKRLAFAMGYKDYNGFNQDVGKHRNSVQNIFEAVFQLEETQESDEDDSNPFREVWRNELEEQGAISILQKEGFTSCEDLLERINSLNQGSFYNRLTNVARDRLDEIMPIVLRQSCISPDPDETLRRMLVLIRKIAGRSVYLQVLIERPHSLERLVRLFSASKWLSDFVGSHPMVIDELLDHRTSSEVPDRQVLQDEIKAIGERIRGEDLDIQMDALRQFKQGNLMRIITADLEGFLPLKQVSDRLSDIAELVLQTCCEMIWASLVDKYGEPTMQIDGTTYHPEFAVVAYGKLGGFELGYGSDLDIVFLHNSQGERQQTNGDKVIDNAVYFARVAQKATAFLSTLTTAGTLYEIDTRLRPNGQSGLLVSSLQAFEYYQLEKAWTWEHQALVRARVVVGSEPIQATFNSIRRKVLSLQRDPLTLKKDVSEMRKRMHKELNKAKSDEIDPKHSRGGIVDIEFMVQYSVLAHANENHALLGWTDNVRLLEVMADCDYLTEPESQRVTEIYLVLRQLTHAHALQGIKRPILLNEELLTLQNDIKSIWNKLLD